MSTFHSFLPPPIYRRLCAITPKTQQRGWLYGMEMDLYKSRFLDGGPDGIWYKHEILRAGVSNCMRMCLIFFGTKHTHSFVPGLKGEAFFPDF